jgi:hypothetical protein
MSKRVFTAEQIRQEVDRRLREPLAPGDRSEMRVSLPTAHLIDAEERNWDMKEEDHGRHDQYVRRVIEEARREFFLSDAADRDEIIGDSFAHG